MEPAAAWAGINFDGGDAASGNAGGPGAGAESAGEREPGSGAANQPPGDGRGRSAGVCDGEFCGATAGHGEPHAAGCGLQIGHREHGTTSGRQRANTGCPSCRASCACRTLACQHDRYAVASGGTESSGGGGGELRSTVSARIVAKDKLVVPS